VRIVGPGVGAVWVTGCLLCDTPAKVVAQCWGEVVVLAEP